jgi:tetratricopeptide (TPR) repeat protein
VSRLHPISGCDNPNRRADVIFVHGLGGDASGTWRSGKDDASSWPHWLAAAEPMAGVWSLGYAASPSKWPRVLGWFGARWRDAGHAMALPDRAVQVLDLLALKRLGERPLFFICHSLGGLLVKQVLRTAAEAGDARKRRVAENTRAVLFLATPHSGAALASLIGSFPTIFGATASIEDLRAHEPHLRELGNWYRRRAPELGIATATYFETRDVRGLALIVDPTSAHPGVGEDPVPVDEDHLSIAKPREPDAPVCLRALDILRQDVLAPRPAPGSPAASPPGESAASAPPPEIVVRVGPYPAPAPRIPRELPAPAERFFGRPAELERLTERLRQGKDNAVSGPAGMGKTALAAQALRAVVGEAAERLAASPFPDGIVFLDLYLLRGQAEQAFTRLANSLAGPEFLERAPARVRAEEACRGRRLLLVVEGGEEADGKDGRASVAELFAVLSPENRRLLLTRLGTQAAASETVELRETLAPEDAAGLLDSLAGGRVSGEARKEVLELLAGHPLALTWAGNLLARGDENPEHLVEEWKASRLPALSDPREAQHTLEWLFARSERGLDENARRALAAAGLLAPAAFPLALLEPAVAGAARPALRSLVQSGLLRLLPGEEGWEFTHALGYRFARQEKGSDPSLREKLAEALRTHLAAALAAGSPALPAVVEHASALLRTDDDYRLWDRLANYLLFDGYDRLVALGRLPLAKLALGAVRSWLEGHPGTLAEEGKWLREQGALLDREGDVSIAQGDLAGALSAYRESLAIAQRLAGSDRSNAGWQRDLSVSHNKVGDVLRAQGDLAGALSAYRESLAIDLRLVAESDRSNAECQRDLSVSHNKVGDVLRAQGDLAGALSAYRESLAIDLRLVAESDKPNAGWQRDLSVSHESVGDVLQAQGDLAGALSAYRESLAIRQPLAESDRSNAEWQRDHSVALNRLAALHEQRSELNAALPLAEASLAIAEGLATLDRTNVMWQNDVAFSRALVARLRVKAGELRQESPDGAL